MNSMTIDPHISIDVTDAKECAVPKDKFRLVDQKSVIGSEFEDIVHNEAPYLHFQILRPKNDLQKSKALEYVTANHKFYATFRDRSEMSLFAGCTQTQYIKSPVAGCKIGDIRNLLPQAAHWFRFYGNETTTE